MASKEKTFPNLSQLQNIIIVSKTKWDNSKTRFGCLRTLWLRKTLKRLQKFVWAAIQQNGFENILKHFRNCCSRNSSLLLPKQPKPYLKHVVVATQENCSGKISKLFYNFALTTFQKLCFGFLLRHFQCFLLALQFCIVSSKFFQDGWNNFSPPQFHFTASITF